MIKKKYLTFEELSKRWNCEKNDIHYAVAQSELVPSIIWDDILVDSEWRPMPEDDLNLGLCSIYQGSIPQVEMLASWIYMMIPKETGAYKYKFQIAAIKPYHAIEEFLPGWYKLAYFDNNNQLIYEKIDQDYIEQYSVFMMDVIEDCELVWHPELIQSNQQNNAKHDKSTKVIHKDHAHISNKLAFLNQASSKFWANAERADRATHPENRTIEAWLMGHGYSSTLAAKAATIIRPEWAESGRKPDK